MAESFNPFECFTTECEHCGKGARERTPNSGEYWCYHCQKWTKKEPVKLGDPPPIIEKSGIEKRIEARRAALEKDNDNNQS